MTTSTENLTHKRADNLLGYLKDMETKEVQIRHMRIFLGQELRTMRHALHWNYRHAASIIGCDRSNLAKLEKGIIWSRPLMERCIAVYRQQ